MAEFEHNLLRPTWYPKLIVVMTSYVDGCWNFCGYNDDVIVVICT